MAKPGGSQEFVRPKAFYTLWQEREGVPIYERFYVENLSELALGEWGRFGCRGAFVNLADPDVTTAAVLELPPRGRTRAVKHVFEAFIYGIGGRGRTTVSAPGFSAVSVEWGPHSLFSPPLNATYVHENLEGSKPLRWLMVSNAPLILSLFHNERFVFDNPSVFDDRFRGQADFFSQPGEHLGGRVWRTNFVADASRFELIPWRERGAGARSVHLSMADNTMACHISEFEVGTYKKAHRHGPGAHVIIVSGEGYSLLWPEGKERVRLDWRPGSMFSPPQGWYHQHFNTGPAPARYVALRRGGSPEHPLRIGADEGAGAQQIEYEDEDPAIREMYVRELAAKGLRPRMPPAARDAGRRGP
jgi:uncharacterized RmlC-like cupin family protein